jgi:hypothetical protein
MKRSPLSPVAFALRLVVLMTTLPYGCGPDGTDGGAQGVRITSAIEEWAPVAGCLGNDFPTANRVVAILDAQGIRSIAYGSLGYTVSVEAGDASRARQILQAAVENDGLRATVYREYGTEPPPASAHRP